MSRQYSRLSKADYELSKDDMLVKMVSKPTFALECDQKGTFTRAEVREALGNIPFISKEDLYEEDENVDPYLYDTFDFPAPGQWFLLDWDDTVLLVNTEGYDYCRYAVEVKG